MARLPVPVSDGGGSTLVGKGASLRDVPPIRTPTLVICGEQDGSVGPELFECADEAIKDCRAVRIPDAGHFMHHERPDVVGNEIAAFL